MDKKQEALDWLPRDEEFQLLCELLNLFQELLREQKVGQKVALDDSDEQQEFKQDGAKVIGQLLPLLALRLLFVPSEEFGVCASKFILELFVPCVLAALPSLATGGTPVCSLIDLMISFTSGIIALLEPKGDEVPAHLQLVIDVFVDLLVRE